MILVSCFGVRLSRFELVFRFQEFRIQEFMCSGVSRVSGFIYVGLKYVSLGLSVRVLGQKIR